MRDRKLNINFARTTEKSSQLADLPGTPKASANSKGSNSSGAAGFRPD
jgi:hypothetical protein